MSADEAPGMSADEAPGKGTGMRRLEADPSAASAAVVAKASGTDADAADAIAGAARARSAESGDQTGSQDGKRGLPLWLIAGVPAVAELIVGGYRIGTPSLWRDEAATISGSQRSIAQLGSLMKNQDAVHAFYYLLMHYVIAVGGISATVLRLPSLIAMCLAVAMTAVVGRRLARYTAIPRPDLVGLIAGLMVTAIPITTRYAQEARPYALTSLFAVIATYALLRAAGRASWSWWVIYTLAMTVTGLFNMFAVLLAVAHGVSLLAARTKGSAGAVDVDSGGAASGRADSGPASSARTNSGGAGEEGAVAPGSLWRWLVACVVSAALLLPVAIFSIDQSSQLSWVQKPTPSTVASLVRDFGGSTVLVLVAVLLGWLGLIAARGLRLRSGLTLTVVAVPWLVLPPVVLIAGSFIHPVYVERYVIFCLPALAMLTAAGLVWLTWLTWQAVGGQGVTGGSAKLLAVLPSAVLAILTVVALISPQVAVRRVTSRPDDLVGVANVIRAHERPGDAILYMPWDAEIVRVPYPSTYQPLRDIAFGQSPAVSGTLRGFPAPIGVIASRLRVASRVWTVQWVLGHDLGGVPSADRPLTKQLNAMHLVHRWQISTVILSLYSRH
jgi:mannosyltransferase